MPAEAGAEASGCPGTANAVKAPLNRAEQEGALGRRPVAVEVSPQASDDSIHTVLTSLALSAALTWQGWGRAPPERVSCEPEMKSFILNVTAGKQTGDKSGTE